MNKIKFDFHFDSWYNASGQDGCMTLKHKLILYLVSY